MVRLIGDLYVISGPKLTHAWDASAYLIAGSEPTLIDCGGCLGYAALKRALRRFGYQPGDIRRVIGTHGHWDHLSGMAQLRAESDAELWLEDGDRGAVESGDHDRTSAFLYGKPFPPVQVDRSLNHGEVISAGAYRLKVIHTPGHSPGSVSLLTEHNDLRILIAGDTLWGGYHPRIGSDLDAWAASLDRLLTHKFDVLTVGHCPPTLIFDAKAKVREARSQLGVYFDPWFKPFNRRFVY